MIRKDTAWLMVIAVFAVGYLLLFEREHTEEAPTVPVLLTAFNPVSYTHLTLPTTPYV